MRNFGNGKTAAHRVPVSARRNARLHIFACLLAVSVLLTGCSGNLLKSARPIDNIHDLDGRRIGVMLSYGPDYLLSSRKDMTLVRYNTVADSVMALCYGRVDAIALERPYVSQVLSSIQGLRMIEEPIDRDGIVALVSTKRPDILPKLNEFLAEFLKTPEYEDMTARVNDISGFEPKEVALTGSGEKLLVGIATDGYPFSYVDFVTGNYEGYDVELMRHFANYAGYSIEFVPGSWTSMEAGVCFGNLDIGVSGCSDLYREDYEKANTALVSDVYMPIDFVFVEVADRDQLKVTGTIGF